MMLKLCRTVIKVKVKSLPVVSDCSSIHVIKILYNLKLTQYLQGE